MVDVGVALTGIEGSQSTLRRTVEIPTYGAAGYWRTERVAAAELKEPRAVARRIFQRLVDATAGEGVDPFQPVRAGAAG